MEESIWDYLAKARVDSDNRRKDIAEAKQSYVDGDICASMPIVVFTNPARRRDWVEAWHAATQDPGLYVLREYGFYLRCRVRVSK